MTKKWLTKQLTQIFPCIGLCLCDIAFPIHSISKEYGKWESKEPPKWRMKNGKKKGVLDINA